MTKAPLLQIIASSAKNGDLESLFINTAEAGARLMLESADAVRAAGSKPDKERINEVIQNMTRVYGFSLNTHRVLGEHLDLLAGAIRLVESGDLIEDLDEDSMFNRDRVLLEQKPTFFNFNPEGESHDDESN
jgi:hypothetical protein